MIVSVPSSAFGRGAGHRRVDEADAALGERGADRGALSPGAIVDMSTHSVPVAPRRRATPSLAEQDLLHLGAVDDHRDDDVARRADLGRRVGDGARRARRPRPRPSPRVRLQTVSS